MKSNMALQKYVAPIIVLVGICLVISAALAATYGVANPIIISNTKASADAARQELLSDADTFTAYTGELWMSDDGKVSVQEVYLADNGCGMVITVQTTSFGGKLVEMVGIGADGSITGVKISSHGDTPGVGTKAMTEGHLSQYEGVSELQSVAVKQDATIDHVSGASVSSNGIHYGVYGALEQFKKMGGVQ